MYSYAEAKAQLAAVMAAVPAGPAALGDGRLSLTGSARAGARLSVNGSLHLGLLLPKNVIKVSKRRSSDLGA